MTQIVKKFASLVKQRNKVALSQAGDQISLSGSGLLSSDSEYLQQQLDILTNRICSFSLGTN